MADPKSVMAVIRAARPTFRNDKDKVAFAIHASFLAAEYMLTATGPPAFSGSAFSSSTNDEVGIERWNELEDEYAFVYVKPGKGSNAGKVLAKCLVMNDKLLVDAVSDKSSEPLHLEINVKDYAKENGEGNYADQYKNLDKLVEHINSEILSKLDDSLEASPSGKPTSSEAGKQSTRDTGDTGFVYIEPRGPQIHPSGVMIAPINPLGGSDLFPGPGAGMYPMRGGFGSGGGMLIGPNDPRWFDRIGGEQGFPPEQPGVPPGARFDPYGPPGIPGFEPNRFVRRPRGRGGGTHPELEHFGSGSDFI